MMTTLRTRHQLLCAIVGASVALGCSSKDDDDDKGNGANNGGRIDPNAGRSGSGEPRVGGSIDLTDTEVNDILNAQCTGWSGEGESLPAVLQLVVDTSRSMDSNAPGGGGSKWDVTRDALESALDELPPSVAVGLLFYPNRSIQNTQRNSSPGDIDGCVDTDAMIPIALLGADGSDHRDVLAEGFDDARVDSYTPTHDAYTHALQSGLLPYQANASKFMLVITDGAPTLARGCVNPASGNGVADAPTDPIVTDIEAAFDDHGVRTFLIGSPGSDESSQSGDNDMRPWLSRAAVVGGTANPGCDESGPDFCHLDMTQEPDFGEALREGLASIAGQIVDSCTFALPDPPAGETIDPYLTNVIVTWSSGESTLVLGDDTDDCTVGWEPGGTEELTLCPETCDAVKADSGARLHLAFGCGREVVPVR